MREEDNPVIYDSTYSITFNIKNFLFHDRLYLFLSHDSLKQIAIIARNSLNRLIWLKETYFLLLL